VSADSYLNLFLSRNPSEILTIFLLSLARVAPPLAISPFLGGKAIPDTAKIGLAVSIAILFLPFLVIKTGSVPLTRDIPFMMLLIKEVLIGSLIGFLISIPYFIIQSTGSLIDLQRGAQSLQVSDPISQVQTSPIGTLLGDILVVLFYALGGISFYLEGLYSTFQLVPVNEFLPASFLSTKSPLYLQLINLIGFTLKMVLQLSAPPLLIMLMTDLFLGIANRMAPQVQITFLLASVKSFIGLSMLMLCWWLLLKQLDIELLSWFKTLNKVFFKNASLF
jgi:type III secretion protein T